MHCPGRTLLFALALAAPPSLAAAQAVAPTASTLDGAGPLRRPVIQVARLDAAQSAPAPLAAPDAVTLAVPADQPRLYYSIPLSAVLGLGGMLAGYGAGLTAFGCEDESPGCDSGPDDFEYTLAWSGLALGAATGAHLGGRTRSSHGSFWASLGGAALGALPVLLMRKDEDQTGMWVTAMIAAPAGAVAADYLVRSPR